MEIIVVCLLIIILILFIRGTTIREGARGKRKDKKSDPKNTSSSSEPSSSTVTTSTATPSTATTCTATTSTVTTSTSSQSGKAKTTNKKHKSNNKHKNPVNPINKIMKKINSIENSQQKIRQSQQDIKQTQSNMDSYYRDLSNNMLTQYTTYKNGFASEYDTKMNKINEGVNNAQTYSNSASVSAAEAAASAASAQASLQKAMEIEKNIFGKLSASIIQNNIIDASGNNTAISSNNTVKEGLESIYTKTTGNKTIFDLQNEVASAINDFYASYTVYIKCAATNAANCSQTELTTNANTLETKIEALKAAYKNKQNTSDINNTEFIANHNALIEQASRVRDLRSSIDQKYALKTEKEIMRDYNASLYTGIGLTVAAASLTYYIIMEL